MTTWRKSSRCDNGACVEVALATDVVRVRDTTDPATELRVPAATWRAFLRRLRG